MAEGVALPEKMPIEFNAEADARTFDRAIAIVDAGFFRVAGVVDVAEDVEVHATRKCALDRNKPGCRWESARVSRGNDE